jgi:hypothetical protein
MQKFSTRGPPMCFVRPAYIYYNIVSLGMMKSKLPISENTIVNGGIRQHLSLRTTVQLSEERQIKKQEVSY